MIPRDVIMDVTRVSVTYKNGFVTISGLVKVPDQRVSGDFRLEKIEVVWPVVEKG